MITWAERAKLQFHKRARAALPKLTKPLSRLLSVSAVPTVAVPAMPERLSSVLAVPSPAVLEKHDSSIAVTEDPDRWCWPHSSAMNGVEIDTFAARLHKFTDKGLARSDGEALADKLVVRDREQDDRRVCLGMQTLCRAWGWVMALWQLASRWCCYPQRCDGFATATPSRDAQLPADLVMQLQRCDGFTAHPTPTTRGSENEHDHH
jgi:hypothetical protein